MAAAGGQNGTFGVLLEKTPYGRRALLGTFQVIQAEFQEGLAGFGLAPRVLQELCKIRQSQRDADAW